VARRAKVAPMASMAVVRAAFVREGEELCGRTTVWTTTRVLVPEVVKLFAGVMLVATLAAVEATATVVVWTETETDGEEVVCVVEADGVVTEALEVLDAELDVEVDFEEEEGDAEDD